MAATALAVACCAGGPVLLAVLGGVALGTVAGVAAGVAAVLAGAGALLVLVMRRRRGSASPETPTQVPR